MGSRRDIQTIYSLGRHFSAAPPAMESFPFAAIPSEQYKFPVPDFCTAYYELEIIDNRNLGYHMMLIGKIISQKKLSENPSGLYHLHLFEFPGSGYTRIPFEPYK